MKRISDLIEELQSVLTAEGDLVIVQAGDAEGNRYQAWSGDHGITFVEREPENPSDLEIRDITELLHDLDEEEQGKLLATVQGALILWPV